MSYASTVASEVESLFINGRNGADWYYSMLRDSEVEACQREYVNESWRLYKPFCPDSDFKEKLAQDVYPILWHLHLARVVIEAGFQLLPTKNGEPDICIDGGDRRIWIEVVSPKGGNGPDAVRGLLPNSVGGVCDREICLRITNAIESKIAQHRKFVNEHKGDVYVIALSSGLVPDAMLPGELTFAEQVLFGLGERFRQINIGSGEVISSGYHHRPQITKRSGATVNSDIFRVPENNLVSGILYTHHHFLNNWYKNGSDFRLILNPLATNKLELGSLPARYVSYESDGLLHRIETGRFKSKEEESN